MELTKLMEFAYVLSGLAGNPTIDGTPFAISVRERTDIAAEAIHTVYTQGYVYEQGKPSLKVKPLFEITESVSEIQAIDASEKLTIEIGWHESGLVPTAVRTVDGSNTCGYCQVSPGYIPKIVPGKTCNDMKKDPVLNAFVCVQVMHLHRDMCINELKGGVDNPKFNVLYWTGAFASGKCGKAKKVSRELCSPKNGENLCEMK